MNHLFEKKNNFYYHEAKLKKCSGYITRDSISQLHRRIKIVYCPQDRDSDTSGHPGGAAAGKRHVVLEMLHV